MGPSASERIMIQLETKDACSKRKRKINSLTQLDSERRTLISDNSAAMVYCYYYVLHGN